MGGEQPVELRVVVHAVGRWALERELQPVEVFWVADQDLAERRRRAEQLRQDLRRARVVPEIPEKGPRRCAGGQIPREAHQGSVGIRRRAQGVEQRLGDRTEGVTCRQVGRQGLQVFVGSHGVSKPA